MHRVVPDRALRRATDSSFLKSGRLTGRLGSVSARPAQGVPRSSYKYPDQTSVVFRVNVFDAEALHESEQKARDRMSRATQSKMAPSKSRSELNGL